MTEIDKLNHRLGEELGFIGDSPRFAWKFSTDLHYFIRDHIGESFKRYSWADRVGKVWMMAERRGEPTMVDPDTGAVYPITHAMWLHTFKGLVPYPANDYYSGFPETKFQPGLVPDEEDTRKVIYGVKRMLAMTYADHMREINQGLAKDRAEHQQQFFDRVEEDFPAFWKNGQGHEPGTRGAHVSLPYTKQDKEQ